MKLGMQAKKDTNFAKWYTEVITKAELIEYTDVGGCYVLRPRAYEIWERIVEKLNAKFKKRKIKNAYFPLFITKSALERESTHLNDFCPEVAWVTQAGKLDDPQSKLEEPLAIRPTSETGMYPHFSKWIQNHRDLPLKINQWNNVVRWEFKQTTPFIRSREFLWQEGHSCFSDEESAVKDTNEMLDVYAKVYRKFLSVPTIKGTKTENERFAGAEFTRTIEALVTANGRAIQAGTSHYLGTNFSKMFDITYENSEMQKSLVYQNSWGFTTRSIGIMLMTHSDDIGLVLPPKVAPIQVAIVPIYKKNTPDKVVDDYADTLIRLFVEKVGVRVYYDNRKGIRPGRKYNYYELIGVPLRIDIGPRDVQNHTFDITRRDTQEKHRSISLSNGLCVFDVLKMLTCIQTDLLKKAETKLLSQIRECQSVKEVVTAISEKCLVTIPFCGDPKCEVLFKESIKHSHDHAIKSLCVPDSSVSVDRQCLHCQKKYTGKLTLFGKSY